MPLFVIVPLSTITPSFVSVTPESIVKVFDEFTVIVFPLSKVKSLVSVTFVSMVFTALLPTAPLTFEIVLLDKILP